MHSEADTIAAIATPPGEGGIAVVRISGPVAGEIARKMFRTMKGEAAPGFESHRAYHGRIIDPASGQALDDVLLLYFASGRSYTGDETVEVSCHGGPFVARRILEAAFSIGARPAGPGEFTKRAFLAGRIDLAQAEAVADLIAASSDRELINARMQLDGALSGLVSAEALSLSEALAEIESRIDFPDEEDIAALPIGRLRNLLSSALKNLGNLSETYREGRVLREGYRVVIVGRTNVGKSSLLNRLLGADRAIVTAEPGTTRDVIEERVILRGSPFILTDTAGLRNTFMVTQLAAQSDKGFKPLVWKPDITSVRPHRDEPLQSPEELGIRRAFAEVDARLADPGGGLLLVVLDASEPLTEDDFRVLDAASEAPHIVALNKADIPRALNIEQLPEPFRHEKHIAISALKGSGMADLIGALVERRTGGLVGADLRACPSGVRPTSEGYLLTNARHKAAVDRSIEAIGRALDILETQPPEILALEVRLAREALDEIAGAAMPEDILDIIFSRFCIGK